MNKTEMLNDNTQSREEKIYIDYYKEKYMYNSITLHTQPHMYIWIYIYVL